MNDNYFFKTNWLRESTIFFELTRTDIKRGRASSTSRISNNLCTPSIKRSLSSLSLKRTPQSVQAARNIKKKDERPLHDKNWQAAMLHKAREYFQQDPEGALILNQGRNLRPITISIFINLVNIVLKNIDDCFEPLTSTNYVELLPRHLAKLMYPGQVSSSMLKTASSMHSWPHVLGILSWLVDLHLKTQMAQSFIEENLFILPSNLSDSELREQQALQLQIKVCTSAWVKWNKNQSEAEDIEIYEAGLRQIYDIDENTFKIKKQNEEYLRKQLHHEQHQIQIQNDEIEKEHIELNKLLNENNYMDKKTIEQENMIKEAKMRIEQAKNDILKLKTVSEKYKLKNRALEDKIKNQPMSSEERKILLRNIEELAAKKELMHNERKHQQKLSDEMDLRISQMKLKVEEKMSSYNIKLLQPSLKHPELKECCLKNSSVTGEEFSKEIDEVMSKQEKIRNCLEEKFKNDQKTLISQEKQNQKKLEKLNEINQETSEINSKIEFMKQKIELATLTDKEQKEEAALAVENIQSEIALLQTQFPDIEAIKNKIKQKTEEYHTLKKKYYETPIEMGKVTDHLEIELNEGLLELNRGKRQITNLFLAKYGRGNNEE